MPRDGQMTKAVRAAIRAVRKGGLDAMGEARAQLAVTLAKELDAGELGLATAAVARELRATLGELPIPSEEKSTVDDLARRRAARRTDAAVPERAAAGDVGRKGSGRARNKRGPAS